LAVYSFVFISYISCNFSWKLAPDLRSRYFNLSFGEWMIILILSLGILWYYIGPDLVKYFTLQGSSTEWLEKSVA